MDELTEVFARDVPHGSRVSGVREQVLPARTWIKMGDGDEIYLDVDANVRMLVRTVKAEPEYPDVSGAGVPYT